MEDVAEDVNITLNRLGGEEVMDHKRGPPEGIRIGTEKLATLQESIGIQVLNNKFGLGADLG